MERIVKFEEEMFVQKKAYDTITVPGSETRKRITSKKYLGMEDDLVLTSTKSCA